MNAAAVEEPEGTVEGEIPAQRTYKIRYALTRIWNEQCLSLAFPKHTEMTGDVTIVLGSIDGVFPWRLD